MGLETRIQEEAYKRARLLWMLMLGLILLVVNAAPVLFLMVPLVAEWFGISPNAMESLDSPFYLQYLMLFSLACFVVGILRGLFTGKAGSAVYVGCVASLVSGLLAFCVLPPILLIADAEAGERGAGIFTFALFPLGFTVLLAVVICGIGGLIGSLVARLRARQKEAQQP